MKGCPEAGRSGRAERRRLRFSPRTTVPLLIPLAVMAGWWIAASSGLAPEYLLPSPRTIGDTLCRYAGFTGGSGPDVGRLAGDMTASLARVACGCLLSVPAGIALGLASGRSSVTALLLAPLVHGLRAVPGISWLPLVLLWLGVGFRATVALIALAAFFPAYLNTAAASAAVPENLIRAGRMLGFSGWRLLRHVIIPSCMPGILTGMRMSLGMGFSYLVLGELTGVPDGLGAMIMDARLTGRVDLVICGILVIAGTGWLCDALLVRLARLASAGARVVSN